MDLSPGLPGSPGEVGPLPTRDRHWPLVGFADSLNGFIPGEAWTIAAHESAADPAILAVLLDDPSIQGSVEDH